MTGFVEKFYKKAVAFWKSILWASIMLVVFLLPSNNLSGAPSLPFLSESAHIILFAVLVWFLVREQEKTNKGRGPRKTNYVLTLILSLCFGILIELLQEISNFGRTAEIKDVLFDLAGILLSFGILYIISGNQYKTSSKD